MPQATITSKGQITIPVEVRRELGLKTGTKVDFVKIAPGVYQLFPKTKSIKDLYGFLEYDGPTVTLEEMDEAIAAGAAESMRG